MKKTCVHCESESRSSEYQFTLRKAGFYKRKSDCRIVRRFLCVRCGKESSAATRNPCYRQKKRNLNHEIKTQLASGVSQRRIARNLRISRSTVARKLIFLGEQAEKKLAQKNRTLSKASIVEFDDLETFEHTKCKPLSVTLAVEHKTRRILSYKVSQMPAKGHLVKLAMKKYGPRKDKRSGARKALFNELKELVEPNALFKSDENPHYPLDLQRAFPDSTHERHKGQRGSIVGQGELKKIRFDPLFSLNHTCAMFRANVNRLFRKTWCTTKVPRRLELHLAIYSEFHNSSLIRKAHPRSVVGQFFRT